jgi:hypothetical protein
LGFPDTPVPAQPRRFGSRTVVSVIEVVRQAVLASRVRNCDSTASAWRVAARLQGLQEPDRGESGRRPPRRRILRLASTAMAIPPARLAQDHPPPAVLHPHPASPPVSAITSAGSHLPCTTSLARNRRAKRIRSSTRSRSCTCTGCSLSQRRCCSRACGRHRTPRPRERNPS